MSWTMLLITVAMDRERERRGLVWCGRSSSIWLAQHSIGAARVRGLIDLVKHLTGIGLLIACTELISRLVLIL